MTSTKLAALDAISSAPDNATFDDLIDRLYLRSQIERGLKAIEEGDVYTEDEANSIMDKWLQN